MSETPAEPLDAQLDALDDDQLLAAVNGALARRGQPSTTPTADDLALLDLATPNVPNLPELTDDERAIYERLFGPQKESR